MIARLRASLHAWLVALDQLAFVTLASPAYLLFDIGDRPSPYETVSSSVGRQANSGWRWARLAEVLIDRAFGLVGSRPGHCQRSIVRADWISSTLP